VGITQLKIAWNATIVAISTMDGRSLWLSIGSQNEWPDT
jgi:hypothetical protein